VSASDVPQEDVDVLIRRCLARLDDATRLPIDPPFGAMDRLVELLREVNDWADDVWTPGCGQGLGAVYTAIDGVSRRWESRWRMRLAEQRNETLHQDMTRASARCLEVACPEVA
jgi:hypothetical protein